ncbi:Yippee putative zincbinding protein [Acanthamoeba castellanii str. Neff]|uniref:Protein yippee-like n=1 Tax=Acanthamoeba castellanii (strain ATCC 30010 / Neff) TaxID=1257118 RepID=L8GWC8_ACACF|nr:Yippee putative zincbinding protein [Acanthamoeba castellanii str. Neff]ELR16401.1 Yippee putative zincbinding protein [Acanthamoeba castellanii str. Neff]
MGKVFKTYLSGSVVYTCSRCNSHLARADEIVSKAFQGRHGQAYLFSSVVNVSTGPREDRILLTGLHTVADISCNDCHSVVGWKYEEAVEESQQYKVGKYILEKTKLAKKTDLQ